MNLRRHWKTVSKILTDALNGERDQLGSEQVAIVQEFLDHNELGLAYEQIRDALEDKGISPLPRTEELLAEAGRLMKLRG